MIINNLNSSYFHLILVSNGKNLTVNQRVSGSSPEGRAKKAFTNLICKCLFLFVKFIENII